MNDVVPNETGQKLEPSEIIEVLRVPINELNTLMKKVADLTNLFVVDAKIAQAIQFASLRGYLEKL
ncbi:hypothetical protein AUK10_02960 [Candidatus Gracilibacteria bacterium CG2_30_37_12]|nr:MAG: hypothetical protein AUK10_02960 [Candidatus Gracilibacteria bacterium CG2_30_37_12]